MACLSLVRRLWRETDGQDVLEYALLSGVVLVSALAGLTVLALAIGTAYKHWIDDINGLSKALL